MHREVAATKLKQIAKGILLGWMEEIKLKSQY